MNLRKNLKKGEIIFHEGNPSDCAYIIGSVSIEILENSPGGQKVLGVLEDNEIFGEMGLIDGQPRSATVTALEESEVSITQGLFPQHEKNQP
jgi:CRP/FNR family transcriptional regulator, cyclic AMP receptor protein